MFHIWSTRRGSQRHSLTQTNSQRMKTRALPATHLPAGCPSGHADEERLPIDALVCGLVTLLCLAVSCHASSATRRGPLKTLSPGCGRCSRAPPIRRCFVTMRGGVSWHDAAYVDQMRDQSCIKAQRTNCHDICMVVFSRLNTSIYFKILGAPAHLPVQFTVIRARTRIYIYMNVYVCTRCI